MRRPMRMKRHSSRWAPAVAAVLILAACGADDGDSSPVGAPDPTDVTTADGDLRAPTPIAILNGGGGGAVATATADGSAAAADVPEGEMRMAQWIAEFVIGDGMPALPTNDVGYVFDTSVPVTEAQVAAIAEALGVSGDVVKIDEGDGMNWRVGPDDGSGPSVWVYEDAQQDWSYSAAWGDTVYDEPCAVSIDSDGTETSDCPEPTPPTGVPTADEAEQRVSELLTALGVDPADLKFDTFADDWFANVDVSDRTDDRAAVRSWHFGFGAEGVLQYASGTLAPAQAVGPYPLVDVDTAVARLADGFYGGFGGGVAIAEAGVMRDVTVAAESVPADSSEQPIGEDTGVAEEPPADEPMLDEPMPDQSMPPAEPLEPVVVTLVDVQPDLWWAWDADGTVWLLPAYRFIDSDGGWHVAPAVTDEFLIQAEPTEVVDPLPVPVEEVPVEEVPAESVPAEEAPAEDDPAVDPAVDSQSGVVDLSEFVGLPLEEFAAEAEARGFTTRVVKQDGESLAVTMDYRTDRINVVVEGSIVVAMDSVG